MILLFIRGFLHVPLDLDSVGITKIVAAWLHGFDPIAVEAGPRLATDTWEFAPQFGFWSVYRQSGNNETTPPRLQIFAALRRTMETEY
jgi:hypothetical protein